eukprot:m51a1_g4807 hypothetical protein (326) ;mRNA; r:128456-129433
MLSESELSAVLAAPREPLVAESGQGGLTGETYLVPRALDGRPAVVRCCCCPASAAQYLALCSLLPGLLPRPLGLRGAALVLEHVPGRDLSASACTAPLAAAVGSLCARVNVLCPAAAALARGPVHPLDPLARFEARARCLAGLGGDDDAGAEFSLKARRAAAARGVGVPQSADRGIDVAESADCGARAVFSRGFCEELLAAHARAWEAAAPRLGWDAADCVPSNWRVLPGGAGAVFVDVEGIRVDVVGCGLHRALRWMRGGEAAEAARRAYVEAGGDARVVESEALRDLLEMEGAVGTANVLAHLGRPTEKQVALLQRLVRKYSA